MERLKWPSLSFDSESAPHWITITSGTQLETTLNITFLNSSTQLASSIPLFSGTFTAQNLPWPSPTESSDPVPGKKSWSNSWKLTVMTLLVWQKASSTPSPWCTSISRYITRGQTFSSSRMHRTMSLTQQKPLASVFFAWWYPPDQFITISLEPAMMRSAASMLPPAASLQKLQRPSKPGQSKVWFTLKMDPTLLSSLIFAFSASSPPTPPANCSTMFSAFGETQVSRYFTQSGWWNVAIS